MMFGTGDAFECVECGECGCLQIAETPVDLSKYYPEAYYSFDAVRSENRLRRFLYRRRARHVSGRTDPIGRLLVKKFGVPPTLAYLSRARLDGSESVLEIGCGTGERLVAMRSYGFTDLTGLDPYLERDLDYGNGVRVLKRELSHHQGSYDFVMLHRAFEYMANPGEVLQDIHRLLHPRRLVLLRIPLADSYALKTYGTDWVQLDARRHLYLHTGKSLGILASETGFEVADVFYDSTAFQFWGASSIEIMSP